MGITEDFDSSGPDQTFHLEYLLSGIRAFRVEKATNGKASSKLDKLEADLIVDIKKLVKKWDEKAYQDSLEMLKRSFQGMTNAEVRSFARRVARIAIRVPRQIQKDLKKLLDERLKKIIEVAREEVEEEEEVEIPEEEVEDDEDKFVAWMADTGQGFVESEYDDREERLALGLEEAILSGINAGSTDSAIRNVAAAAIGMQLLTKPPQYWSVFGVCHSGRARSAGTLLALDAAQIDAFEVGIAGTCEVCKKLSGIRFSTKESLDRIKVARRATSPQSIRYAWPWVREESATGRFYIDTPKGRKYIDKKLADGKLKLLPVDKLQKLGVGAPPHHGLCQCRIKLSA